MTDEAETKYVQTHVAVVIIHRADDRQAVRNAFSDWNVHAGVDAIYDSPSFHEREVEIR